MNFKNSLRYFSERILGKRNFSVKRHIKKPVFVLINNLPKNLRAKVRQTPIYYEHFKPSRTQRVFLKNNLSHMKFLEILNERKVKYVLLRWWEDLPNYPEGEDLNLLVRDEDRDLINDLVSVFETDGRKCDIYTVFGTKKGSRFNVPVFSQNLSKDLLETRYLFNGGFVPSPIPYFASVAYHAIFHKGHNSGIHGFNKKPTKYVYDYSNFLKKYAQEQGIEVDITVNALFNWLKEKNYAPADDTLSKLVEFMPELNFLQKRLYSDIRGGDLLVYMIREQMVNDGHLMDFKDFLEDKYEFDVLDIHMLNEDEKIICKTQIRGGKWDKGPYKYSGGPPVALVVAFDYNPWPLNPDQAKKQSRMTNRNNPNAKYEFRERIHSLNKKGGEYNGVHSADNELDAWSYISLVGKDYLKKITSEVEIRRVRYERKWGVVKSLTYGQLSKVEVIKYNNGLAVKKTFRPGKEKFFERELFAVKELSKEMSFIPTILEEGEGFIIMPFLENILVSLNSTEKKKKIGDKKKEIFNIIFEMYKRKLTFINFSPESLIITTEDKLFCTGFSYLQRYKYPPESVKYAFEIVGLPENFDGDIPPNLKTSLGSFQKVWKPYFGIGEFQNFFSTNKRVPENI